MAWIEDPSNSAPAFERARLRAARAQLDALGLTPAMLALSAARLAGRAGPSTGMRRAVLRRRRGCGPRRPVRRHPHRSRAACAKPARRSPCACWTGPSPPPEAPAERAPLGKLEPIAGRGLRRQARRRRPVDAGACADHRGARRRCTVEREPGREPLPELSLAPGTTALWDGRFWVRVGPGFAGGPVQVRALGEASLRDLRRRRLVAAARRRVRRQLCPSFWHEGSLMAVPPLRYRMSPRRRRLRAAFVGIQGGAQAARARVAALHGSAAAAGSAAASAPNRHTRRSRRSAIALAGLR